jgi:phospholipid-binding lipoprotein MlaA
MLPILGPSSVRDATGFALNQIAGPYNQFEDRALNLSFEERAPRIALNIVDQRAGLIETADPILANALDPYTTLKSSYIQARTAQINDNAAGRPGGAGGGAMMEEFEPFDFDEDGAPTGEPDEPDGPETPEEPQD